LVWLGEQVNERGIGNGISLIIFASIVSGLPRAIGQSFEGARQGEINLIVLLSVALLAILAIAFIVWVERAQRRVSVNYAKRQIGNQMAMGQTSHVPLKVNMSGVIPAIFASSIVLFPASISMKLNTLDITMSYRTNKKKRKDLHDEIQLILSKKIIAPDQNTPTKSKTKNHIKKKIRVAYER
jgi:preprotein translocase subunit SecY